MVGVPRGEFFTTDWWALPAHTTHRLHWFFPTVANSPASLKEWLDLIPAGCGGDALADTEALYDEGW